MVTDTANDIFFLLFVRALSNEVLQKNAELLEKRRIQCNASGAAGPCVARGAAARQRNTLSIIP